MIRNHALFTLCVIPLSIMGMEPWCTSIEQEFPGSIPTHLHAKIIRKTVRTLAEEADMTLKTKQIVTINGKTEERYKDLAFTQGRGYLELQRLSWLTNNKGVNLNCPDDEYPDRPLLYRYAHDAAGQNGEWFHHLIVMLINRADPCYAVGAGHKSTIELIKDEGNTTYHGHVFQLLKSFMPADQIEAFNRQLFQEMNDIDDPEEHQRTMLNYFPTGIPRYVRCASKKTLESHNPFEQIATLDRLKFRRELRASIGSQPFDQSTVNLCIEAILSRESKRDAADKLRSIIAEYQEHNEYKTAQQLLSDGLLASSDIACRSKDLSQLAVLFAAGADSTYSKETVPFSSPLALSMLYIWAMHNTTKAPYSSLVFGLMNSMVPDRIDADDTVTST